jgi:hypothetical protein
MFKKAVSNDPTLCNEIVYEYAEYYTPIPMDLNVLSKYIAREEQVPLINYLESPGYSKVLTLRTGGGKMQDVKEPVLTPKGWVAIGDLKVGDEVFTPKGKRAKVNGIFHHSNKFAHALRLHLEVPSWLGIENDHRNLAGLNQLSIIEK